MSALPFRKVEGIGNDFLLLDRLHAREAELIEELVRLAEVAPRLCDRRSGVGADGLLVVSAADDAEAKAKMIVINFDGSRPEMCGNGLRCVASFVAAHEGLGIDEGADFVVETDAGGLTCRVLERPAASEARVSVHMGPARDTGKTEPAAGKGRRFIGISMGNPHAIHFVGSGQDPEALARRLGPALEVDPAYPERSNIEFARVEADGSITLWVWERGCGITLACGTGACATAAAAVRAGHCPADTWIPVHLPGGTLSILVPADESASVQMLGPATDGGPGVAQLG